MTGWNQLVTERIGVKIKNDSNAIYMRHPTPPLSGGTWQRATGQVLTAGLAVCAAK